MTDFLQTMNNDLPLTDEEVIEAAGWKVEGWEDMLPLDGNFSIGPVTGAELRAIARAQLAKVATWLRDMQDRHEESFGVAPFKIPYDLANQIEAALAKE